MVSTGYANEKKKNQTANNEKINNNKNKLACTLETLKSLPAPGTADVPRSEFVTRVFSPGRWRLEIHTGVAGISLCTTLRAAPKMHIMQQPIATNEAVQLLVSKLRQKLLQLNLETIGNRR